MIRPRLKLDGRAGQIRYTVNGRLRHSSGRLGSLANSYVEAVIAGATDGAAEIRLAGSNTWHRLLLSVEEAEVAYDTPLMRQRMLRLRARRLAR